ncbi:hypothetical protein PL263_04220 [Methylomonas sp. EFPC3]|uniref:hypothetical protein n=1 Tax=Methylomonas sp. EFPC3 TaxID=3021710 RepID=UPI002417E060|nr:hypothetical protein [Methylomonas sp. EFPC3]WFP51235.1 hypothetical protein PL263_04220 [Methylomonas sp. EFPC3]
MAENKTDGSNQDGELEWWKMFNEHQKDGRQRADFLAKSIFLLSGGTLALSIQHFTDKTKGLRLTPDLVCMVRVSWVALVLSIVLALIVLVLILRRDYSLGERWRRKLQGEQVDASGSPTYLENLIWGLGITSLISFILGLVIQAFIACHLVAA